jgi:hypothetical protein
MTSFHIESKRISHFYCFYDAQLPIFAEAAAIALPPPPAMTSIRMESRGKYTDIHIISKTQHKTCMGNAILCRDQRSTFSSWGSSATLDAYESGLARKAFSYASKTPFSSVSNLETRGPRLEVSASRRSPLIAPERVSAPIRRGEEHEK